MTTWLLPLRHGENDEARYAIRSWAQNSGMVETDRLVVIGGLPTWLNPDVHLPGNPHKSGPANVYANVRDACASGELGDRAIVCNDDFICLAPSDPEVIAYRGPLRHHIARVAQQTPWWASSLRLTHNLLRSRGVERPLSYELHRPLVVDVEAMAKILGDCWNGLGFPPQWRSVYGNLHGIGGEQSPDGKVILRSNYPPPVPWLSSTDGSWRWLASEIREQFPTRSRWES